MNPWTPYSERRPTTTGVYEWRIPSKAVPGAILIVASHMRKRGAGYVDVLSPHFDYWDGYRVIIGAEVEWRETADHSDLKTYEDRVIAVEGLDISPCIYCGKTPTIRASQIDRFGVSVSPFPWHMNSWSFHCCAWGSTPALGDPREIERIRREAFGRLAGKGGE